MIKDRKDLKFYIEKDQERMIAIGLPNLKDWILQNEKWYIYHYLRHLRYVEYYKNRLTGGGGFLLYIPFLYHWFKYKRIGFKMRYNIAPNTTGAGLSICHAGDFIWVHPNCKIGRGCTLRPGVVFGRKSNEKPAKRVEVGNYCDFGVGSKILGDVVIGNNVSVGANAVVTKDIPNNAVVVGIPAKVIKFKNDVL